MAWLIGILAIVAGSLNTVQAGANSVLGKSLSQPILACLIVSAVNAFAYLGVGLFVGIGWPATGRIGQTPWWAWTGGLLGAVYVLAMVYYAEKLGSAIFTGLTVTAAIVTSVLLDHFGWVGFKEHPAGVWRIFGCVLMIGGLSLISIF